MRSPGIILEAKGRRDDMDWDVVRFAVCVEGVVYSTLFMVRHPDAWGASIVLGVAAVGVGYILKGWCMGGTR